jgi:hypothetical protein
MDRKRRGLVRFPVWGVVTEIQQGQNPNFKIYQREIRGDVESLSQASEKHIGFMYRVGVPVANRIFRESGIRVDYPGNVSDVGGNPLFFEPKITAPSRLVEFIKTKPIGEREALMSIAKKLGIA